MTMVAKSLNAQEVSGGTAFLEVSGRLIKVFELVENPDVTCIHLEVGHPVPPVTSVGHPTSMIDVVPANHRDEQ
jgi:hypothetical protein